MNKETLLQQIEILLETTLEQHHQINSAQGRIPQIEIDIVLANLRQTYEYVSMLDYVNRKGEKNTEVEAPFKQETKVSAPDVMPVSEVVHVAAAEPEKVIENVIPDKSPEVLADSVEQSKIESIAESIEELAVANSEKNTEKAVEENEVIDEPEQTQKVEMTKEMVQDFINMPSSSEEKTPYQPTAVSTASLFDDVLPPVSKSEVKSVDETPSYHEKLSRDKSDDNSLVEKLQKKRIADLKAAIGINEKFLFINELFEGNLSLYNEGIEKLNGFENFNEARGYVDGELRSKFNWTNSPKADKMLMELVERRFIG